MMSAGGTWSARSPPDLRSSHGAPDLLHLGEHVFDAGRFVRPPPIVGDTRCRQATGGGPEVLKPIGPPWRFTVSIEICEPRMKFSPVWSKFPPLKSSMLCFCALGPMYTLMCRSSNVRYTLAMMWAITCLPTWPLEFARPDGNLSVLDRSSRRVLS